MVINYKKIFILLILLFFGFSDVKAGNAYKNELTKVSLSSISTNDVKVTLYMTKPYTEPLRLLKKNDGEFVLILPETYTSAPQKPSISDVIGEVTDADIKLYSFVSNTNQNGYTKIVIKTNGLVNLYPEAVATGGGSLSKTQNQVKNIISEQIRPTSQTTQTTQTSQSSQITQTTQTTKNENKMSSENIIQPKIKVSDVGTDKNIDIKKIDNLKNDKKDQIENKKQEVETQELKSGKNLDLKEIPEFQNIDEIKNLPKITEDNINIDDSENVIEQTENIEKQTISKVSIKKKIKNKLSELKSKLSKLKVLIITSIRNIKKDPNLLVNILTILISVVIAAFSIKFAVSILKNSGRRKENFVETKAEDKNEYSDFFKNIIESEFNNNGAKNIPKILSEKRDYTGIEIDSAKSHKEVLNEDQNLTWQEKFRALQNNKKSLLQDNNEDNFEGQDKFQLENTENMNIENPIKKLTQDFRAVKKVLEKQQIKKGDKSSIKQDFTPEKIEKIEVISFEDLQNRMQKPKVQINKTTPIKKVVPKILTTLKFDEDKGLYLVDYKEKISLIGYVKDKVFKLNSYSSVNNHKLYARLTEKTDKVNTYIVKIDNSKLIVDVDNEQMKLKLMY